MYSLVSQREAEPAEISSARRLSLDLETNAGSGIHHDR